MEKSFQTHKTEGFEPDGVEGVWPRSCSATLWCWLFRSSPQSFVEGVRDRVGCCCKKVNHCRGCCCEVHIEVHTSPASQSCQEAALGTACSALVLSCC